MPLAYFGDNYMTYDEFLKQKSIVDVATGMTEIPELNPMMFDYQRDIVTWALKRGRACIFADCGMGKTLMELELGKHVEGNTILFSPLAVAKQTLNESEKFGGYDIAYSNDGTVKAKITVTNYEQVDKFNPDDFSCIIIDESSILKSYTSKYRNEFTEKWNLKYRYSCSATPSPNDFMELGNQSEFIGAMKRTEMLSMFFVHDGGDTSKWRIKGHAQSDFWKWVCSWAVMISRPSDLGYSNDGFILPDLNIEQITVESDCADNGFLFEVQALTLQERQQARRNSIKERCAKALEIINQNPEEQWLIWCDLNSESEELKRIIPESVEVKGSDDNEHKMNSAVRFQQGTIKRLISKPQIFGWGMNYQKCHNMIFVGLSDSYELFYQAVRRSWRFGQTQQVNVYVVTAESEGAVVKNIQRKERQSEEMKREMVSNMKDINSADIRGLQRSSTSYNPSASMQMPSFI